jgi:hypothetical protein
MELIEQEFRRVGYLANRNRQDIGHRRQDFFTTDVDAVHSTIDLKANEFIRGDFDVSGFFTSHDINHLVFRYQLNPGGVCLSDEQYFVKAECIEFNGVWQSDEENLDAGNSPCSGQVSDEGPNGIADTKIISFYVQNSTNDPSTSTSTLYCRSETKMKSPDTNDPEITDPAAITIDTIGGIPLVDNVERVFVFYGVDTNDPVGGHFSNANKYVRADQVADAEWQAVVSVRIHVVLMSSEKHVATGTPGYQIDGVDYSVVNPEQGRLYRVFTTTVAFRN